MRTNIKSWHVVVLRGCKMLEYIRCLNVDAAHAAYADCKKKYINKPKSIVPDANAFTFHIELY